ncbi:hypothetical protein [Kitasatospora sp. MAP5-34]|uniref:WXG100 family type VII secretion target n=1 Tax=Kitasatospora sp. MAP5-34 TaxID=3035102 RepID=UPI0024741F64|nr:hypothetical protein [Kitasatospora sp. MAP5-34]
MIAAQPMQTPEGMLLGDTPAMVREMPVTETPREMVREMPMTEGVPAQEMTREMPMEGFTPRIGTVVGDTTPAMTSEVPASEGFTPRIGTVVGDTTPAMTSEVPAERGFTPRIGTMVEPAIPAEQGVPAQPDLLGATPALKVGDAPLSVAKVPTAMMTPALQSESPSSVAKVPTAMKTLAQPSASPSSGSGSGGAGGAGQGFQVNPGQYSAAVSPMMAASEQVSALYTSLSSFLPGLESQAPWGKDESGKQFAEGDKGYLKYSADTLKTLKGLPDGLKYIADGLKAMADGYESADSSASADLTGQDGQLSASPPLAWSPSVHTPITGQNTYEHLNQSGRH